MRTLLIAVALFALALSARAQNVTNIQFTIKITDNNSTNQVTLNAPADYVRGFTLSYAQNVRANGTNAPTFPAFVKQEVTDRLRGLQDQSTGDTISQNKVAILAGQLAALWPTISAQDQNTLSNLAKIYVP